MDTWACLKCGSGNGKFDSKCWNCGKKRPYEFAPSREEQDQFDQERFAQKHDEQEKLDQIGNRPIAGAIGGLITSIVMGAIWFYGNITGSGPTAVVSVLLSAMYGGLIGGAVWICGKGFSHWYGLLGAVLALLSAASAEALVSTYYLALNSGYNPAYYLKSLDFEVYLSGFRAGFSPLDPIFYLIIMGSSWWLSWRSSPEESRLWFFGIS